MMKQVELNAAMMEKQDREMALLVREFKATDSTTDKKSSTCVLQ
jgi:hypothetical protein